MHHRSDAPSDETLAKYAALLEDAYRSWPTWHTGNPLDGHEPTHVEMFWWRQDAAGWIGDKSNFEVARDAIRTAADTGREDTEVSGEQVYECGEGSSAWDVAQLFVQVYEGGCPEDCPGTHTDECTPDCDPTASHQNYVFDEHDRAHGKRVGLVVREGDFRCYGCTDTCSYEREVGEGDADQRCTYCKGHVYLTPAAIAELEARSGFCFGDECEGDCHGTRTYTAAFRQAVALAEHVEHEYPFLDEDDYYEQRREVFEKNLDEALADVALHYPYDTDADHKSIVEHASEELWELSHDDPDGYADWGGVRDAYDRARGEHFLALGREFMRNEIPGQLALMPA